MAPAVRVVPVRWLTPGVAAMTLGRIILVRRGCEDDEALMAHEMAHVEQWQRDGAVRFLWRYLGAYLAGRRAGLSHAGAYRAIPYEVEARRVAGR